MKKLAIAITSLLLITGCSSTPTITNTKNIKEYILKDNVAYDSFSSYSDSDTIIRLPNGEYIHGTKEVNGKYYDSDQDSGAIQAKKAKYYALLAMDVNNYLTEEFEGFNDSDEVFYNKKNGGFTDASTVMDENGNEKDLANNPNYDSMTVKEAKEKEAVRCRELRDYLYEDFREGIISKEDYKELHDGYTEKRKKAEEAVRSIDQQISEVLESKSDKYHWLDYFAEHQNIQELTRTVAVELIDQILVYDKKHIEVRFNFDDCYQSLLRQIQSVGCDVSTGMDGRIEIQKREVV